MSNLSKYCLASCYDTKECVHGNATTRLSDVIEKALAKERDLFFVNLDGAKPGSQVQRCMDTYTERAVNSGIAEQNMVGIAAGLALAGRKVICLSYGPFVVLRAMEQIYMDVAYNDAPVCIVLTGTGLSGGEGPTHNVVQDFAMLRCIPNITVVAPCDPNEAKWAVEDYLANPRPMYIRCGKANMPLVYREKPENFCIGKSELLVKGGKVSVFATGGVVHEALCAVLELQKEGVYVNLVDVHTIKPFDREIVRELCQNSETFISIEDHSVLGGLGTALSETITDIDCRVKLVKIAIPDTFSPEGTAESLYEYYGINVGKIKETINQWYV